MLWSELCEKAKEIGANISGKTIFFSNIGFAEDGFVFYSDSFGGDLPIAYKRTIEQMYQIMEALK